ncbi:MAG: helicase-associated domain-containing protein, partial [Ktedonobacterales bacterium]|nr:helicase-associated domain-containing protein [Ktedonobacterales bacterium]
MQTSNPAIVQSDRTILLEVDHPLFAESRDALAQFAELEKSPEHIHTYRLTPLSLWNAAAASLDAPHVLELLARFSKYDLPPNITADIREYIGRYGRLKLQRDGTDLILHSADAVLIAEVARQKRMQPYILGQRDAQTLTVDPARRGHIKQALVAIGFPAEDLAGYTPGERLPFGLRAQTLAQAPFALRTYQEQAVEAFHARGAV